MIFDQLCGIAERQAPELVFILQRARIFQFDTEPPAPEFTEEEADALSQAFFLPFPTITSEDPCGVVMILSDLEKDSTGLAKPRELITGVLVNDHAKEALVQNQGICLKDLDGALLITRAFVDSGALHWEGAQRIIRASTFVTTLFIASKTCRVGLEVQTESFDNGMAEAAHAAMASMTKRVLYVNTPNRFVLEETPAASPKRSKNAPKLLRSHERPLYTLLTPGDIRTKLCLTEPKPEPGHHASPVPHERRAHTKTLRSERFVNKRGCVIFIPATWVGPQEAVVGNKRYKVRVDL